MLDFCKGNNFFFILNGRHGHDKEEGRVTCKGVSTVDYCICTSSLLNIVLILLLLIFSDVHSPITVSISGQSTVNTVEITTLIWTLKKKGLKSGTLANLTNLITE
jgi:hypothetical protein